LAHLRKGARNVLLSLAFTCGLAYAVNMLFPFTLAALALGIIVVGSHEAGHFYSAWIRGGNPAVPIVVPLGVAIVGVTRVRNLPHLSPRTKRYIIAAGPLAGTMTAVSLLPYAIIFQNSILVLTVFGLIALEIHGGTMGSDGKRWRRERCDHGTT